MAKIAPLLSFWLIVFYPKKTTPKWAVGLIFQQIQSITLNLEHHVYLIVSYCSIWMCDTVIQ